MGKANLSKANGFHGNNWMQALRYAEIAATKLKQLKDRRLETVEDIDDALRIKIDALTFMARHREALECAKEDYTLWAMNHMRNPGSLVAALGLIQSCLHNKEFDDAILYAREAMFMIKDMKDNFIPNDERPKFLAEVSYYLAQAIVGSAETGGIPSEEKQKTGEEAIEIARQAIELHTQLHGIESTDVAADMNVLSDLLDYFNDVDDDEILRLLEQSIAIYRRVEGSVFSMNVAAGENSLGNSYAKRAARARATNDLDRCMANVELALTHFREAARVYRAINHLDSANLALRNVARAEEQLRQIGIAKAVASATAGATTG